MQEKNDNQRSPRPALEEELAQYFLHITDENTDTQAQANGCRSSVSEVSRSDFPLSSHLQPSDYGPPTIPEPDRTYVRFNGVETNTDVSLLEDWTSDSSDDSEYDSEQEYSSEDGACEPGDHSIGQEEEYDNAGGSVAIADGALNALQRQDHGQAQFDAAQQVHNAQASGQEHVSGFVDNDGDMCPNPPQNIPRPGLIVGPSFSQPSRIGPDGEGLELHHDPFALGPNAARLQEHSDESTAAHTAYYGNNLPTREARCAESPRFRCQVCNYTSRRLQALQRHVSTRTDNDRYSCPHCGRRFVRQDLMRIHSRKCKSNNVREESPDNVPGPRRGPRGPDSDGGPGASMTKAAKAKAARSRREGRGGKHGGRRAAKA